MPSCTFFGHRDCTEAIQPALQDAIHHMISHQGVNHFYVGHQGKFDQMAFSALQALEHSFPWIRYEIVLAYLPQKENWREESWLAHTMLPDGIEQVPKRFAIVYRNNWLLEHADHIIAAIDHPWGGAAQFVRKAERMGKQVLHLIPSARP